MLDQATDDRSGLPLVPSSPSPPRLKDWSCSAPHEPASADTSVPPFDLSFANYPGESASLAGNAGKFWPELAAGTGPAIVPERDARHQMGQNAAFFDGHARWLPYQEFTGPSIRATVASWLGD